MKFISLLCFIILFISAKPQTIEHQIYPNETDIKINGHNAPQLSYLNPEVQNNNKLLLFIPGTNATPNDYKMFLRTAANIGYHTIGLTYENLKSINIEICPATQDPTCHGRARREIWFGEDTHDSITINYENSILNRLTKFLKYLELNYPNENWGQYLVGDTNINWSSVVIAGHSQGAGNATYGSKFYKMNRVIMISWVDWMWPGTNPLWITQSGLTPDSAYFGFIHTGDASIYNGIPIAWSNFGMQPYGAITSIDSITNPYNNSHSLITSKAINHSPTQTNFHNATCVDWVTTITNNGDTLYKPVWEYMLGIEKKSLSINKDKKNDFELKIFPNPANSFISISNELMNNKDFNVKIYNIFGNEVAYQLNQNMIDVTYLRDGIYTLKILANGHIYSQKFIKK